MNAYQFKRGLLAPYTRIMRLAHRRTAEPLRSMLELFYYKPSFYRFCDISKRKPDLLWDAPRIDQASVVFDVGAFAGDWTASVWKKYRPHIFSFEVDPGYYPRLEKRFQGRPEVRCFNHGLGRANARVALAALQVAAPDAPSSKAGPIEVQVRDIVELLAELGLTQIDWMKLNIEGAEYDLLERLIEADRLRDVRVITVQFHEWLDHAHARRRRIRDALRRTHRQAWNYPFIWEQWERR